MAQWFTELAQQVKTGSDDLIRSVSSANSLDAIPLASQGKSLVQVVAGDKEGARRTQENFTKRCVGVSQLRSTLERRSGDPIAAAATRAEFDRSWHEMDEAAKAAFAPMEPIAKSFVKTTEQVVAPVAQAIAPVAHQAAQGAEQAVQRARTTELGRKAEELGTDLVRRAEVGAAAAATSLRESDLLHKFGELLKQHHGRGRDSASCGSSSGSSLRPINSLDRYTILTEASGCQCGAQCPCCLEAVEPGEAIRVLPCFHTMHHRCAEQWLLNQPICPVCRCDLAASLEAMQS